VGGFSSFEGYVVDWDWIGVEPLGENPEIMPVLILRRNFKSRGDAEEGTQSLDRAAALTPRRGPFRTPVVMCQRHGHEMTSTQA